MDFFAKGVQKLRVVCRAEFLQQILALIAQFFCDVCVEQVHVALVAWCCSHCLAVFVVVGFVNGVLFVATTELCFNGQVLFCKRQFDVDLFKFTHVALVAWCCSHCLAQVAVWLFQQNLLQVWTFGNRCAII